MNINKYQIRVIIAVLILMVINLACGSSSDGEVVESDAKEQPIKQEEIVKPETDPKEEPKTSIDKNLIKRGTYIVGSDIQPGLYKGEAQEGLFGSCYWARLKDLTGELEAIITNDNSNGQFYIEVKDSDFALETGCELYYLDTLPDPVENFPTTIKPGTYLIDRDILPGTYKGQADEGVLGSCYWARLNNVSGDFESIIANSNSEGQFYVQIQGTDFALTTGCDLERVGD